MKKEAKAMVVIKDDKKEYSILVHPACARKLRPFDKQKSVWEFYIYNKISTIVAKFKCFGFETPKHSIMLKYIRYASQLMVFIYLRILTVTHCFL